MPIPRNVAAGCDHPATGGLAQAADAPQVADAMQIAPYLDILDRALEDRLLSPAEQGDLAATAGMLGLSASRVRDYGTRIVAETAFWPMIGVDVG